MVDLARELPPLTPDRDGYEALTDWLRRFTDLYERHGALLCTWTEAEIVDSELGEVGVTWWGSSRSSSPPDCGRPSRPGRPVGRSRWSP